MALGDKSALPLAVCGKIPDANGNITLSVADIAELEAALSNNVNRADKNLLYYRTALGGRSILDAVKSCIQDGYETGVIAAWEAAPVPDGPPDFMYGAVKYVKHGTGVATITVLQSSAPPSIRRLHTNDWYWIDAKWIDIATAADLAGKADAIGVYYQGDAADGVPDTSTDSALIVGLGQSKNAELWEALGRPYWAFIWQQFFASRSVTTLRTQLAVGNNGHMASRTYDNAAQAWTPWVGQATATKPQEMDLPLAAGWTAAFPCKYSKDQFSGVFVTFKTLNTFEVSAGAIAIATLPAGFRPSSVIHFVVFDARVNHMIYPAWIDADGQIYVGVGSTISPNLGAGFCGSVFFRAA